MNKTIYRMMSVVLTLAIALGGFNNVDASTEFAPQMAGNSYYVAVNGNDANPCTQAAPCKSFNKAISVAQSGDVVQVMPGTYNQQLIISKSGITFEGNGALIDTTAQNGIWVRENITNVIVRGFKVTRTRSHSIFVQGSYVTIENNTVYHSILENGSLSNGVITCFHTGWGSGIKAERGSSNVVFRNNTVYETCGEGIAATMSKNVVIEGNKVWDNKQVNIYVDNSSFVQVLNNHSYCTGKVSGNTPVGIAMGEETGRWYEGWGAQLRDVTIKGNLVENCHTGIMAFSSDVGGTLTNVLIDQNLIPKGSGNNPHAISLDNQSNQNVTVSNNGVFRTNIWVRSTGGVTLRGNYLYTGGAAATPVGTATATSTAPPSQTPAATGTSTPVPVLPTMTHTPVPPTAAPPTITQTAVPPTNVPTSPTPLPLEPSPTPTLEIPDDEPLPPASAPSPSETIFDDRNGAFVYSDGWRDMFRRRAHEGSFKVTNQNRASVTFTFTGESFSILYTGGPRFGTIEVYVDGVLVGKIDERMKRPAFQQRWDYTGKLEPGAHTLKLVFVKKHRSSDAHGSLDGVIVR
jgi:hypothetical protein